MNQHRVAICLAALASAVLGVALAYLASNRGSTTATTVDKTEPSGAQFASAPLARIGAALTPNAEPLPPARLIDILFSAHDGPAFVASAINRPEEGGMYYAKYVLSECRKEVELAGTGISNFEALDARARGITLSPRAPVLPDLCRNFSAANLGNVKLDQIESRGVSENDLLFAALAALREARALRSHVATHDAIQRLLSFKNPIFLQSDGLELLRQKTGVLWFQSKAYDFDDESLLNAMHLVPCDFGLPCGGNHKMVARHCRIMKRCYASLEELIAREGSAAVPGAFVRTQFLRQRITLAVRRKDVAAFVPPRSEFEEVVLHAQGTRTGLR